MVKLYTKDEFLKADLGEPLGFRCDYCKTTYFKQKRYCATSERMGAKNQYCNTLCRAKFETKSKMVPCNQCGKLVSRSRSRLKRSKHSFCGNSCAMTYKNSHKTHGSRRSKLEVWLEERLTIHFPDLEIHYNRRDTIKSELDIYIPDFKIAIELNGIFHYEPIFGQDKLDQTKNNDKRKAQACFERGISFCTIDTSGQKRCTPKSSQKYLDIIMGILASRRN